MLIENEQFVEFFGRRDHHFKYQLAQYIEQEFPQVSRTTSVTPMPDSWSGYFRPRVSIPASDVMPPVEAITYDPRYKRAGFGAWWARLLIALGLSQDYEEAYLTPYTAQPPAFEEVEVKHIGVAYEQPELDWPLRDALGNEVFLVAYSRIKDELFIRTIR